MLGTTELSAHNTTDKCNGLLNRKCEFDSRWADQIFIERRIKMLEELKCKNCGAPLTIYGNCEYCKSKFIIKEDEVYSFTSCSIPSEYESSCGKRIHSQEFYEMQAFCHDKRLRNLALAKLKIIW